MHGTGQARALSSRLVREYMPGGAICPYFGAKRMLASRIVSEMGGHRCYWELFAGSMAVLLAKPQAAMETVNDLFGDLINLGRVLRDPKLGPQLYRRLRRTWFSEPDHRLAAEVVRGFGNAPAGEALDIGRAYNFMVCSWMGRNGVTGTQSYNQGFAKRFTGRGGGGAVRFAAAVDSMPAWRRRMRRVTILSTDSFELLERIDDEEGTVIYADPPYVKKGATYVHDFKAGDHVRLARGLSGFQQARVLVSYYDCPEVRALYKGWTIVECPITKGMVNHGQRATGVVTAPELLIINGPSMTADQGLFD